MTFEQKYYEALTPNEWKMLKIEKKLQVSPDTRCTMHSRLHRYIDDLNWSRSRSTRPSYWGELYEKAYSYYQRNVTTLENYEHS